jgi:Holliday junction resolvase RusA-like endonuclease
MESKVKKILTLVDFCQLGEEGSCQNAFNFQKRDIANLSKMIKNCMSTHNVFFSPQKVVTLQKGST